MTWELVANIKGADGSADIPDPLVLDEIKANDTFYINGRMRFVSITNGGRLEVQNGSGTWIPQAEWTEA